MMRRLWLIFAQACTVALAFWFVVSTLRPAWLPSLGKAPPSAALSQPVVAAPTKREPETSTATGMAAAAQQAAPAVVLLRTAGGRTRNTSVPPWHPSPEGREGLGSGVIVDAEGHILTNHHVVEGAKRIEVQLADGREAKAELIGSDPETDLALLRIDLPRLPVLPPGTTSELHVGDPVLAIGNPFGVGQTVTGGIVSALGRNQLGINVFENFIQTDAAINPGNSGGALVDARGRWVGINSAIYSRSGGNMGIGFSIPVELALDVMQALKTDGRVTRGWIGVQSRPLSQELIEALKLPTDQEGVLISGVVQDAPASNGGVKPGDVLRTVAGQAVANPEQLLRRVASLKPDSTATLVVQRGSRTLELAVKVGRRPPPSPTR